MRRGNPLECHIHVSQAFGSVPHEPEDVPATRRQFTAYLLVPGVIAQQRLDSVEKRRNGFDVEVVVQEDPGPSHQELCVLLHGPRREERKPALEHPPLVGIEHFVSVSSDQPDRPLHIFGRQSMLQRFVDQAFALEPPARP